MQCFYYYNYYYFLKKVANKYLYFLKRQVVYIREITYFLEYAPRQPARQPVLEGKVLFFVIKEFDKNSHQKPHVKYNNTLEGKNPFTLFITNKRNLNKQGNIPVLISQSGFKVLKDVFLLVRELVTSSILFTLGARGAKFKSNLL